jgi:hypothetical protein
MTEQLQRFLPVNASEGGFKKMAESKYGKYISRKVPMEQRVPKEGEGQPVERWPGFAGGTREGNYAFWVISEPMIIPGFPHTHPYDELLFFVSGNPTDILDFKAEVQIALGEEWEKHVITSSSVVCIPAGLMHCPVVVTKVDEPILYGHVMPGPYSTSAPPNSIFFPLRGLYITMTRIPIREG